MAAVPILPNTWSNMHMHSMYSIDDNCTDIENHYYYMIRLLTVVALYCYFRMNNEEFISVVQ